MGSARDHDHGVPYCRRHRDKTEEHRDRISICCARVKCENPVALAQVWRPVHTKRQLYPQKNSCNTAITIPVYSFDLHKIGVGAVTGFVSSRTSTFARASHAKPSPFSECFSYVRGRAGGLWRRRRRTLGEGSLHPPGSQARCQMGMGLRANALLTITIRPQKAWVLGLHRG